MAKSRAKPRKSMSGTKGKPWKEDSYHDKPLNLGTLMTKKDCNPKIQKKLFLGKGLMTQKDKKGIPLGDWNINFTASGLWIYMPWLVVFGVGLYALKRVWRQK